MVLKLYGSPESPFVLLVAAVLLEKKVPFEVVLVDLSKGEQKTPEYLTKHPFGQVPYIVRNLLVSFGSTICNLNSFGWLGRWRLYPLREQSHLLLYSIQVCWPRDTATPNWAQSHGSIPAGCICTDIPHWRARQESCSRNIYQTASYFIL